MAFVLLLLYHVFLCKFLEWDNNIIYNFFVCSISFITTFILQMFQRIRANIWLGGAWYFDKYDTWSHKYLLQYPFKIHNSLIIWSFNAYQSNLLTASLNKPQINKVYFVTSPSFIKNKITYMNQNEQLINITSIFVKVFSSSNDSSSELLKSKSTRAWNKDTISSFLPCNRITQLRLKLLPTKLKLSYNTTIWNCAHILNTRLHMKFIKLIHIEDIISMSCFI